MFIAKLKVKYSVIMLILRVKFISSIQQQKALKTKMLDMSNWCETESFSTKFSKKQLYITRS